MSLLVGIGFSKHENPYRAAQDAAIQAKLQADSQTPALVLVYATAHYSRIEAMAVINEVFPESKIIGSSTSGLILSNSVETNGISVLALGSQEQMQVGAASLRNLDAQHPDAAAKELAKRVLKDFGINPRLFSMVFFDGFSEKGPLMIRGLKESFGQFSSIIGGGSFDGFQFAQTFQFSGNEVLTDAACAVMIGGQIATGLSSQHGWKPLGKPRIIDKAEKNIIHRINGKSAISLYEEFLGQVSMPLFLNRLNRIRLFYPLGILIEDQKKYLVQNVVDVLEDGSLICQAEIPQGAEVHIMIGNKDSCRQAAEQAAKEAQEMLLGKNPELILIFESAARQKLLGRSIFTEIQTIKDVFGENIPIFGMYTYGEFGPLNRIEQGSACFMQNETINILAIGQRKAY